MPETPQDLAQHQMIGFLSSSTGEVLPLEFTVEGKLQLVTVRTRITVDNSDMMADLARHGWGLVQAPRYRFARELESGALVQVLSDYPPLERVLYLTEVEDARWTPSRAGVDQAMIQAQFDGELGGSSSLTFLSCHLKMF